MLPHVDAKDGHLAVNNGVLVLGSDDAQAVRILDQPAPAAALKTEKSLAKRSLEVAEAAPGLGDLSNERRGGSGVGLGGAHRREVLPEERVVDVAAAVELDGALKSNLAGNVGGGDGGGV